MILFATRRVGGQRRDRRGDKLVQQHPTGSGPGVILTMRITIRARKQPTICPSALSRNWLNWNCIGLSSTRMLMVLASAPSDPRRLFCTSIPIKNAIAAGLMQSNSMLCCVAGMITREVQGAQR